MEWILSGGIPKYGLPLQGWPEYGIPGTPETFPSADGPGTTIRRRQYEPPEYYKKGELLEALEEFRQKQIIRDDQEFIELITMILKSGILE